MSPASAPAGSAPVTLTVNGTNFLSGSIVRWNGQDRPTTFVSAAQLRATISASDLASAGTAQVTVYAPPPGGGASSSGLTFTITPALPPALAVSATSVAPGAPVTVTLTGGLGGSADYLTLAATGSPNASYVQFTYVGTGVTSRTWTVGMPATAGTYEFRLFVNNGATRAATSPIVTVVAPGPPALAVSATNVTGGAPVTVTLTNGAGGTWDWMALAATSAPNGSYLQFTYVGAGVSTRTWTVNMPLTAGTYEFRLFLNGGTVRAATSPTITVVPPPPPVLSVSATSVAPGAPVTVSLTNGAGGTFDWMALAAAGTPNTSYIYFTYVGAGVTTRTWTINMPLAPGTYEFRLFPNGGTVRSATSPPVTVTSSP
jgi:hypothetical protein